MTTHKNWQRWKKAVMRGNKPVVSEEEFLLTAPHNIGEYTLEKYYYSLYGSDEPVYKQRFAKDAARDRKKFLACINAKIADAKLKGKKDDVCKLLAEKREYVDFHKSKMGDLEFERDFEKNKQVLTPELLNGDYQHYRNAQIEYAGRRIADLSWQISFIHRELFDTPAQTDFDPRTIWLLNGGANFRNFPDNTVQLSGTRRAPTIDDVTEFVGYHKKLQRISQQMYGLYYYVYSKYDCEQYIKRYVDPDFVLSDSVQPLISRDLVEKYEESIIYKEYVMPEDLANAQDEGNMTNKQRMRLLSREGVYLMHEPLYNIFGCATFGASPRFDEITLRFGVELLEYPRTMNLKNPRHTVANVLDHDIHGLKLDADFEIDEETRRYLLSKPFYCFNSEDDKRCADSTVYWHFAFEQHTTSEQKKKFAKNIPLYRKTMKLIRDDVYKSAALAKKFREIKISDVVSRAVKLYENAIAAFYSKLRKTCLAKKVGRFSGADGMLNANVDASIVDNMPDVNYCQEMYAPIDKLNLLRYYRSQTPCKFVVSKVSREYIMRMFTLALESADKCMGGDACSETWRLLEKERKWYKMTYFRTELPAYVPEYKSVQEIGIRHTLAQLEHAAQIATRGDYYIHFKFLLEHFVFAKFDLPPMQEKVLRKIVLLMLIYDYHEDDADGSIENDCLGAFTQLFQEVREVGLSYPLFSQIKDFWSPAAMVVWDTALSV